MSGDNRNAPNPPPEATTSFSSHITVLNKLKDAMFNHAPYSNIILGRLFEKHNFKPLKVANIIADHFGFRDDEGNLLPQLEIAARLAEVTNPNAFHNNQHFVEVAILTAKLCDALGINGTRALSLITAAFLHDYDHNGKPNWDEARNHMPYARESHTNKKIEDPLRKGGIEEGEIVKIQQLILTTDPTPLGKPEAPINIVLAAVMYHESRSTEMPKLPDQLAFLNDPDLALDALVLHCADVGHIGLNFEIAQIKARSLANETGVEGLATPDSCRTFMGEEKAKFDLIFEMMRGEGKGAIMKEHYETIMTAFEKADPVPAPTHATCAP